MSSTNRTAEAFAAARTRTPAGRLAAARTAYEVAERAARAAQDTAGSYDAECALSSAEFAVAQAERACTVAVANTVRWAR